MFVREQVAGDVLFPGTTDGITALGFIAAGPWDLIGHAEVPETKIDGKVARHLDRDDMVSNTINTFVGLTVQCAQCHNHKFDPIRQEDYYRLQAVFAALDRADRPYYTDPAAARKSAELKARAGCPAAAARKLEAAAIARAGGAAAGRARPQDRRRQHARQALGPSSATTARSRRSQDTTKWVQVDLGRSAAIDRVVLWGCHDDFNGIGAGFGFPVRFKVEASNDAVVPRRGRDGSSTARGRDVPNPGIAPQAFPGAGRRRAGTSGSRRRGWPRGRTTTTSPSPSSRCSMRPGRTWRAARPSPRSDTIEAPPRWRQANLVDGYAPGRPATAKAWPR